MNVTAFMEGMDAFAYDDANGKISDNPHQPDTNAFECWYKGYNAVRDGGPPSGKKHSAPVPLTREEAGE